MFPYRRLPNHITGLYVFTVANFIALCHITLVQGDIAVISLKTNQTVLPDIPDMPAYFGGHIDNMGIKGQVVYAKPANACVPIDAPPGIPLPYPGCKWFVLIMRSGCNFSKKVQNAELAGFNAAIIHNVGSNQLEPMGPDQDRGITIPSVFIGESDGMMIKTLYTYEKGYFLFINNEIPDIFWSIDLDKYLLPFACMLAVCFIATMSTMVVKCIRDRRQRQRHRLPTRLLKKLPIQKFKKGDHYDICAICLEDYVEGEKLRVLPCSHTYHAKCIDPWLTESRRTCPVCKRKVLPSGERRRRREPNPSTQTPSSDADSDNSSDEGEEQQQLPRHLQRATESTPLLQAAVEGGGGGSGSVGNINRVGRDMVVSSARCGSYINPLLTVNDEMGMAAEISSTAPSAASPSSSEGSSTFMSSGDWYQSFSTPNGSPQTAARSTESLLSVPVVMAGGELLSSGEHSVNGEYGDFTPILAGSSRATQDAESARGPVEIAIDVAAARSLDQQQPTEPVVASSSLPSTSVLQEHEQPLQQQATSSSSRSSRRPRGNRSSRRKRSATTNSHDMVV